ncbi:short-chain dehydrogenase [Streptomyces sioyaensis]|uniref:phthiocerol/phthiodiolone dimycocerosyl transferase family protein n=1 Tax=Streptomyces sioyaensis TaxID=67364 RepID=UPI00378C87B4
MTVTEGGGAVRVRRPLSPMERWYWICDQISPLNVIARVHVTGAVTGEALSRAGARLTEEHPLLRVAVAVAPDGSRPRFVAAKDARIPVRTVRCDELAPEQWEREVNDVELVTPLEWHEGPLARIVDVAQGAPGAAGECHDLILTVSHVIADGTTAMELLRRLVELAAASATAPPADAARPRRPLPPPEALLPKRINGVPRTVHLIALVIADQIALALARPRRLEPATPVPPALRRTRLIRHELDAAQLDALVRQCRREGVTVHSALAAAMALAVSGTAGQAGHGARLTVGSPVDFRADLVPPVERRDAGAYVATVPSHVRVAPANGLWAVARGAHRDLRRRKQLRQHLALVSLLRFMAPRSVGRSARSVAMVDRVGPGNICLSNIGRYDFPDRAGRWELSGAQFVAGISVSGYLVATVNTSHGALRWNFTYIDGAVPRDRAERIAHRAVRILLSGLGPAGTHAPAPGRAVMPGTTTTRG